MWDSASLGEKAPGPGIVTGSLGGVREYRIYRGSVASVVK